MSTVFDEDFFYVRYPDPTVSESGSESTVYNKKAMCARANMTGANGSRVYGHVDFRQESIYDSDYKKGVKIIAELNNVWEAGLHAFGVHTYADLSHHCERTGERWNPEGVYPKKSGDPDAELKKAGDLGNLLSKRDGSAFYLRWEKDLELQDEDLTIIGRPVVLLAGEDTFDGYGLVSARPAIACGIIEEVRCNFDDESEFTESDNFSESDDHYSSASSAGDSFQGYNY